MASAIDKDELWPLALAILGAGVLRLGLTVVRRIIAGKVSVAVEFDLREHMYAPASAPGAGLLRHAADGAADVAGDGRFAVDPLLPGLRPDLPHPERADDRPGEHRDVRDRPAPGGARARCPCRSWSRPPRATAALSRPALQEVQQRLAELTAEAEESVSGIRVVKAFAREEHMLHRFQRSVGRVFDQNVYSTRLRAFYNPLMGFLPSIGLAVVLFVGGRSVIDGDITLGEFTAFYAYVIMLTGPMRMLGTSLGMAQRAAASGNRMFEILDRAPRIESAPDAPPLPEGRGQVELHDVTLRYGDGTGAEPALESVSMAVEAGSTVALVGPTGSGKTSLVALLARLYDPTSGSVSIDGADLRDVDVASVRRSVSFVADESFLFSASVAENIAYARPEATQEEIEKAARLAQAHGFIERLPDGYETVVGDRGLTLSGGQRQRVAIARALLADPRILILDDATSSVDARTEAEIKRGLQEVMRGRTTFVVAHRLSTISLADEIVVMDEGRVVDRGTHEELLERCDLYREIAEHGCEDAVFLQRDLEEREEVARL